ncbi:MAG: IclR family transcriptional regulator [Opitutales bacterium]|nr:IclR family transcriptional regulator [Opitutales bacterium]
MRKEKAVAAGKASVYTAPALTKGLRVLELLASSARPFTQTEIARALGRTPGELYRMLAVLEQEGYVNKDGFGGYSLTLKLLTLGHGSRHLDILLNTARGFMREFSWKSGEECHLSVLEDGRLTVIAHESGSGAVSLLVKTGSVHHPLHTASGRLLLAHCPPDDRAWHLKRAAAHFGGGTDSGDAPAVFERILRDGYSEAVGESLRGIVDTAYPVGDSAVRVCAALASSRFPEAGGKRAASAARVLLHETARSITRALRE